MTLINPYALQTGQLPIGMMPVPPQAGFGGLLETGGGVKVAVQRSSNNMIRAVKAALKELGLFHGAVSGPYDAQLKSSILAFQQQQGLQKTGLPNKPTRVALKDAVVQKQAAQAQTVPQAMPQTLPQSMAGTGTIAQYGPQVGVPGYGAYGAPYPGIGIPQVPWPETANQQPSNRAQASVTNQSAIAPTASSVANQSVTNRNRDATDNSWLAGMTYNQYPYLPSGTGTTAAPPGFLA
jgi:peptidoglycan hydrolase-like protein with peptidoglycan-binding domain